MFTSLVGSTLGFATTPTPEANPCKGGVPEEVKPPIWTALGPQECGGAAGGSKVQSGADVTVDSEGVLAGELQPITADYKEMGMCTVNVHWHLGAEHKNTGTYDKPPPADLDPANEPLLMGRRLAGDENQAGWWCPAVPQDSDINMSDDYEWKHCEGLKVGYTYEIHWPHSNLGDCGSKWQYQSHFMDGVLCNANAAHMSPEDAVNAVFSAPDNFAERIAKIGVQALVFTLTNDDAHDYPEWDMMKGFNPTLATNVAIYQGSTTAQKNGNEDCSGTGGMVTWQVDRGCHKLSAKAFDKLCGQMKAIKTKGGDDMSSDLYPHNSRATTFDSITTDIAMPVGVDKGR